MKNFLYFISVLFAAKVLFVLGVWIFSQGLTATLNGWMMPSWLFVVAIVVDVYIAWRSFTYAQKIH